jgi:hypothetical protein
LAITGNPQLSFNGNSAISMDTNGNINIITAGTAGININSKRIATKVKLLTTVVSTSVPYVEFNFQPWLSIYRKFVLEFQNVETGSATQKYYYLYP